MVDSQDKTVNKLVDTVTKDLPNLVKNNKGAAIGAGRHEKKIDSGVMFFVNNYNNLTIVEYDKNDE